MMLGLSIGYSGAHLEVPVALVQRAEELGYDSVWSAEAYGSDARSEDTRLNSSHYGLSRMPSSA